MKKIIIYVLPLIFVSAITIESLFSIVTKKEDAVLNKNIQRFIMVDEATGLALAKEPLKYDPAKEMPINYFTVDIPDPTGSSERNFTIHNMTKTEGPDEYDWVLEDNADEKTIFFARSKFISIANSMHWRFIIRGERVLLRNVRTGNLLKINADGKFSSAKTEAEASKIKLIHVY